MTVGEPIDKRALITFHNVVSVRQVPLLGVFHDHLNALYSAAKMRTVVSC